MVLVKPEGQRNASAPLRHPQQCFEAQFQIAFGENSLDGALLEFLSEFENGAQDRATSANS